MPGIIKKLKAANKKRKVKKAIKRADKSGKTAASAAYLNKIVSRTTDPVKGGSGSINKWYGAKCFIYKSKNESFFW